MEKEVITLVSTQGAFAVLFVWLLVDTRKDSKLREMNGGSQTYQLKLMGS